MDQAEVIELILELHRHDGVRPIGKLPGLWKRKLDDQWTLWINGHLEPRRTSTGVSVAPGECYVEFNGWPGGLFSLLKGEGLIAGGSLANYETFCEALRHAMAPAPVQPIQRVSTRRPS